MAHFAGSYFPTGFGVRQTLKKTSLTTPTGAGTTIGSTEGSDKVSLDTAGSTDLGAGLYNVNAVIVQRTASDAATSDVVDPVLTYTNEVGTRTQVAFTVPAATTLNHKTAGAGVEQAYTTLLRVSSGVITVALRDVVTGAKTAGKVDWHVTIEKVGSDA